MPVVLESGGHLLQGGGGRVLLASDQRARLVVFGDAIVEAIQDGWDNEEEPGSITTVERRWASREKENELRSMTGRKVWVFATGYGDETLTRRHDRGEYRVTIDVVRRFEGSGEFDDYWIDDEVLFVQDEIWDKLSNPRAAEILDGYWPDAGEVAVTVDEQLLAQNKVFWCRVELTFRSIQ